MNTVPITLREANAFVDEHHRHHKPARGCKFVVGAERSGVLVGVAIVSRPVSRVLDDGRTAEVVRLCSDGTRNVCSFLLGAVGRICREMGYWRVVTYTLPAEGGASLRGAGWTWDGQPRRNGEGWGNRPGRREEHPEPKHRWLLTLKAADVGRPAGASFDF